MTRHSSSFELLRRWAVLLDSAFRVPGTSWRFGLDALLGLVPGLGDIASPVYTAVILLTGLHLRLPAVVQLRMVLNSAIDMALGLVPVVGDLVDITWKANLRNLALLERHLQPGTAPSRGDYVFVLICVALVLLIALTPIVLAVWVLSRFTLV